MCVCNGEPKRVEILRDDSPWDKEGFRLKNIWIRRTVSRKIACALLPHLTLAGNFMCDGVRGGNWGGW